MWCDDYYRLPILVVLWKIKKIITISSFGCRKSRVSEQTNRVKSLQTERKPNIAIPSSCQNLLSTEWPIDLYISKYLTVDYHGRIKLKSTVNLESFLPVISRVASSNDWQVLHQCHNLSLLRLFLWFLCLIKYIIINKSNYIADSKNWYNKMNGTYKLWLMLFLVLRISKEN